jgi:hypothetical protein
MNRFIDTLYIHRTQDYRQYSAITILHTLQFTVTQALGSSFFTSRILTTDLSLSYCRFNSNMKSTFHSLIPFLSFLQLPIPKTRLNSVSLLPSSYPGRLASQTLKLHSTRLLSTTLLYSQIEFLCPFITPRHGPHGKHRLPLLRRRVYSPVT